MAETAWGCNRGRMLAYIEGWKAARANLPRVEGDMERQRDAYAKAMAVALEDGVFPNKVATKKKIEDLLRDTPQPAPDERKDLRKAIESLDGAAVVNLDEPSPGDLERLAKENRELLAEVKRLRAQAQTEPTREQVPDGIFVSQEDWNNLKFHVSRADNYKQHTLAKGLMRDIEKKSVIPFAEQMVEQVRELVEAAREVVKWIHYSPYRSALEKALAPFAEKGGS